MSSAVAMDIISSCPLLVPWTKNVEVIVYREGYETPWARYYESSHPFVEEFKDGTFWVYFTNPSDDERVVFHIWPRHFKYKIINKGE